MKVLLIGALGQLGADLVKAYAGSHLVKADIDGGDIRLDITDRDAVRKTIVDTVKPELVINAAAAHNVPQCEEKPALAYAVNATGARNLAMACHATGARLVHISTDYVFGRGLSRPLTEADPPAPLSTYGASKLAGEHLIAAECSNYIIVRSAALYGSAPCRAKGGQNFVNLMLHLAKTRGEVKVVTDEITTPTYTAALAEQIKLVAEKGEPGLYHASCQGACSWYQFARAIFEIAGMEVNLQPATQEDFPSPVKRPAYSVLDNRHLNAQGLDIMPEWSEALYTYLHTLK